MFIEFTFCNYIECEECTCVYCLMYVLINDCLYFVSSIESSPPKVFSSPIVKRPHMAVNGDAPRPADDREAGDGPSKTVFSVGDSDSDSIGSQGGQVKKYLL